MFLNLSLEEFPNRLNDLPKNLVKLSLKNPKVKIGFDVDVKDFFGDDEVIYIDGNEVTSLNIPCVTVCIITHNRTNVACATIENLIKHIKYGNIKWCISDDMSDAFHIPCLIETFKRNGINDVEICKTTEKSYGLGAALNNGLKCAWKFGELILTVEDDWILQRDLNLYPFVEVLMND